MKKQMQKKDKTLRFFISFGFLISRLHASHLPFSSALNIFSDNSNGKRQQPFPSDPQSIAAVKAIPIVKAPVYIGPKIGSGGYGTIYEGIWQSLNVIIKKVNPEKGDKGIRGIQKELNYSQALLEKVSEALKNNPAYSKFLEADPIIPVIAQTSDGSLVQKRIQGKDLSKIVSSKAPPYTLGYPDHLEEAILRAANFFRALAILHNLGFVHCDIKPGNVMIDDQQQLCHIIDLGAMKKIGETIQIHSSNGAPEFIEQTCVIKDNNEKKKKLKDEQTEIANKIQQTSDVEEIAKLRAREKEIEEQLQTIANTIQLAKSLRYAVAQPAYDVYSAAAIYLAILFGKAGSQFARYLYFRQTKDPVQFKFLQIARYPYFNATKYFTSRFRELNQMMEKATGRIFPEIILDRLAIPLARMSSLDSTERPLATEIFQELRDIHGAFKHLLQN